MRVPLCGNPATRRFHAVPIHPVARAIPEQDKSQLTPEPSIHVAQAKYGSATEVNYPDFLRNARSLNYSAHFLRH